jgi:hypothetical protein
MPLPIMIAKKPDWNAIAVKDEDVALHPNALRAYP